VQWYFDNLLPEEKLRELIAADARLRSHEDAFALLEYLGAESAGSLTLLPPGELPPDRSDLQPLPYEALSRRILGLPRTTLTREAPKRMSLAGAQHKLLAVLKDRDVYEPVGATPSTHILKPDHPDSATYPASTYLEWLTMRLASAAKLACPRWTCCTCRSRSTPSSASTASSIVRTSHPRQALRRLPCSGCT
jgi:serine/threonine-protein kinase HipA